MRREIALLFKTEDGWLQVDVTNNVSEVDAMLYRHLKKYPLNTPYKVQQRVVQFELNERTPS